MEGPVSTVLGPGARLGALAAALGRGSRPGLSHVEDLAEALDLAPGSLGWLVLDVAATPLADLGLLRRLRARHAGLRVLWTGDGEDLPRLGALAAPEDPFRPWPLDVTTWPVPQLAVSGGAREAQAQPAEPQQAPRSGPRLRSARSTSGSLDPDLGRIEAILAGFAGAVGVPQAPPPPAEFDDRQTELDGDLEPDEPLDDGEPPFDDPLSDDDLGGPFEAPPQPQRAPGRRPVHSALELDEPLLTKEELEAFFDAPEPAPSPSRAPRAETPGAVTPLTPLPRWYRDQVADLADLVQRAELASHAAAEGGAPARAALDGELARLRQFVRTLGCVAAPPSAGATPVDVSVLVEETLASLAQRPDVGRAGRPRFLFRSGAGLVARADKGLLAAGLDALLVVAAEAGGPEDVVRTEVRALDDAALEVRVDFAAGRLAGLAPATILEPYALRSRLPQVGANALAAAGGIFVGHGGDLALERTSGERLVFRAKLPRT